MNKICISDIRAWVKIGCSDQEKFNSQKISIDVTLIFENPVKGMQTDNLDDTVCYSKVTEIILNTCLSREFNLIENLCYSCSQKLVENLDFTGEISVTVKKVPPVPNIHGYVSFTHTQKIAHKEVGGYFGKNPTEYGDWQHKGKATDF